MSKDCSLAEKLGRFFGNRPTEESDAKDARTPDAGAQVADSWQSRSVWSACVFSAAFLTLVQGLIAEFQPTR
jgi:hypothetical protein